MSDTALPCLPAVSQIGRPPARPTTRQLVQFLFEGKSILFLMRFPKSEDLKDGYYQRVMAIDRCLAHQNRIYVDLSNPGVENSLFPQVRTIQAGVLEIKASSGRWLHRVLLQLMALAVRRSYAHSILRLDSPLSQRLFRLAHTRVLDVHGVVPEEFAFHGDAAGARTFNEVEQFAVGQAGVIVCVTNRMASHLQAKHALGPEKSLVVLPILAGLQPAKETTKPFAGPSVIYCGGLHKWQQVDKMLAFVHRHQGKMKFTFLVTEPEALLKQYRAKYEKAFPGLACSVAADEVKTWYRQQSFGLVLREDVVVNQVACPTKLIEYLQHDIVPIVDSPAIGDFLQFKYAYLGYQDALPQQDVWQQMVKRNKEALRQVYRLFAEGTASLRKAL